MRPNCQSSNAFKFVESVYQRGKHKYREDIYKKSKGKQHYNDRKVTEAETPGHSRVCIILGQQVLLKYKMHCHGRGHLLEYLSFALFPSSFHLPFIFR